MATNTLDFKIKVDGKEVDLAKTSVNEFKDVYTAAQKKLNTLPLGSAEWKQLQSEIKNSDKAFNQAKSILTETEGKFKSLKVQIRQATIAFQEAESKGDLKGMKKAKKELDDLNDQFEVATLKSMKFQDALATMPGVAGFVGQSIQGVDKAFKVLVANPILAVITAVVGAFMFLKEALGKTSEGQAALNKVSQAFSKVMGPILALINTVAVPIFEKLADIIGKVGDAFSWFAEKLGVSKKSIEQATKDVDKVGQEAAEKEKERQEKAAEQREKEAEDRKQKAEEEKKRKQEAINTNNDLKNSEEALAKSRMKKSDDVIKALNDEQTEREKKYKNDLDAINKLIALETKGSDEYKQLLIKRNELETTFNNESAENTKSISDEKLKIQEANFKKAQDLLNQSLNDTRTKQQSSDEKELQDLDIKLAKGELREDQYQQQLYQIRKTQLDNKKLQLQQDEIFEKEYYKKLYDEGKISKTDYEAQLLEIQKFYNATKLENQQATGQNEFENAKAQAQLLVDLKRFQTEAETALEQAKVGALQQLGDIVAALAGENKGLQITALLIQQAASVAQILSRSAAAKSSATSAAAPLLANPLTAPAGAVALKAALTANQIATFTGLAGVALAIGTGISKISSAGSSKESGGESKGQNLGKNYEKGGLIGGKRHAQGGTIIEAEQGEAIMTRGAVTMFKPLLSMLNQMGGGTSFTSGAVGGARPDAPLLDNPSLQQQPTIMKTYVVSNELTTEAERQARLKDLSTL